MKPVHDRRRVRSPSSYAGDVSDRSDTANQYRPAQSPYDAVGNAARTYQAMADPNTLILPPLHIQGRVSNATIARNALPEIATAGTSNPNTAAKPEDRETSNIASPGTKQASEKNKEETVSSSDRETSVQTSATRSQNQDANQPRHKRESNEENEREATLTQLETGGMQIQPPPSITLQSLFIPFSASSTLSKSNLEAALSKSSLPKAAATQPFRKDVDNSDRNSQREKSEKEIKNALDIATERYAQTTQLIDRKHGRAADERNQAVQSLIFTYNNAVQETLADYLHCDANISQSFNSSECALNQAAESSDQRILAAYAHAKSRLFGTAAWAREAVNRNASTAQTQIDKIVTNLSSAYVGYLDEASQECQTAATEAHKAVSDWRKCLPTQYPDSGGGMERAQNEAKRLAGEAGADRVLPVITVNAATVKSNFITNKTQVALDIRASVYPTLNARAQDISTKGKKAVETAFNSAVSGLARQVKEARQHVRQMHTEAVEQLRQQRLAARAQLEMEARHSLSDTHAQVERATTALITATQALLPNYSNAARQLEENLLHAAAGGPQALSGAAQQSAAKVTEQIDRADALQQQQRTAIVDSTESSLRERLQQTNQQLTDENAETGNRLAATSQAMSATLGNAAATMTAGFGSIADGVRAAAEAWSKPLEDVFADYLSRMEQSLQDGLPKFKSQVDAAKKPFLDMVGPLKEPSVHFTPALDAAWTQVRSKITGAKQALGRSFSAGIFDRIDEGGVTGAVRGLTAAQGDALRSIWPTTPPDDMRLEVSAYHDYSGDMSYNLDIHLKIALGEGSDDYNAAINYLNGNTAAGARYELEASMHWYNDEESRIESVMRSLTAKQREELHNLKGWADTAKDVRDALDGTDLKVFDALDEGKHAKADLLLMLDRVEEARISGGSGNNDELNNVLAEYSREARAEDWGGEAVSGAERRRQIQAEFAAMKGLDLTAIKAQNPSLANTEEAAAYALFSHVTRNIDVDQNVGEGQSITVTLKVEGAQNDLARALIFHGEGSPEARAASLGVEAQRQGGPNIVNLDKALVDPRLNPNLRYDQPDATVRERMQQQALEDRARVMEIFARQYKGSAQTGDRAPKQILAQQLQTAFGDDKAGAFLAKQLVEEDHPSPETAAYALQYAIDGVGTNNELIDRVMPRMNRDEIAEMRQKYREHTGRDLYADLGVHGHGWFGDLSGDDRLRFERQTLGTPRNDQERAEVAAFTIQQQRNETGWLGSILASGTIQEQFLNESEAELTAQVGGTVSFGADGVPQWKTPGKFDESGHYQGDDAEFQATLLAARLSSENYSAKIDQYANAAAMGIAIVGAIAAAVASVATGGAASPLLFAAIAGITGLAAMGAQRAISGGRYGWEQAALDLGMTAVQALTAGLGQSLSLASRGGMAGVQAGMKTGLSVSAARQLASSQLLGQMGRLTGNAFMDKLVIGMISSGLGSLGQTALDENTWKKGGANATETLFAGLFRGILTGGVTAGVTNAIEDLPLQRLPVLSRILGDKTLGERIGESTNVLGRGVGKSVTSGIGGAAGRGAELEFERARGTYRGDSGDIFQSMLEAGLQQTVQGMGEGAAEARAQAIYNRRQQLAAGARATETDKAQPATTPHPSSVGEEGMVSSRPTEVEPIARVDTEALARNAPTAAKTETPAPRLGVTHEPVSRAVPEMEVSGGRRGLTVMEAEGRATKPQRETMTTGEEALGRVSLETGESALRPVETDAEMMPAPAKSKDADRAEGGSDKKTEATTERAAPHPQMRRAAGAAAAIADSEMQLAPARVITDPEVAINRALQDIKAKGGPLLDVTPLPNQTGPDRLVEITRSDGRRILVRIEVGDTDEGHVASFRPAGSDAAEEFVVTLSKRARETVHARALAHELAELTVHGLSGHAAAADLLRASRLDISSAPLLSAHDRGRLAELELLSAQLKAVPSAEAEAEAAATRQRLQGEIEALAAHLGLLHSNDNDPRLLGALGALTENSPARVVLDDTRKRAKSASLEDALVPARRVDENARLSAADRRQLAHLDELGAQLALARRLGDPGQIRRLTGEVEQLAARLGLMDVDAATASRVRIALSGLEPDSPGALALAGARQTTAQRRGSNSVVVTEQELRPGVVRRRSVSTDLREGGNDALRPGLKPDERTVISERDQRKVAALKAKLEELDTLRQRGASDQEIKRLRLEAEQLAGAMGLVHGGEAAEARRKLALTTLGDSEALRDSLINIVKSAKTSALLQPRLGTLEDLPLLSRQIEQALGMGDHEQAARLVEIAGFRLEESGFLDAALENPAKVRELIDQTVGDDPKTRHMVEDALERHRARLIAETLHDEVDSIRVSLAAAEEKVAKAREEARPEKDRPRPARERERDAIEAENLPVIERLRTRQAELTEAAARAARVAFRPHGASVDSALEAALGDPRFRMEPRLRHDPDYPGNPTQQRLTRQIYGDSPEFQSWERFKDLYFSLNPSVREHQQGVRIGTTGETKALGAEELARVFGYWRNGEYVDEQTGYRRSLSDIERIRARGGEEVYKEGRTPAPRVAGDKDIIVRIDESDVIVSAQAEQRRKAREAGKILVSEAEQQRRQARDERRDLVDQFTQTKTLNEQNAIKAKIKRLDVEINDLSEALGVAAGRRFGATLVNESELQELHGPRVPDLIHVDKRTGRVTVIECKGGESPLGERRATSGGRTVMAEQGTPEYLRSLAMDMLSDNRAEVKKFGRDILRALNEKPPNIDMYVVRQPIDNNDQLQPIEVKRYPINSDGR